MTWTTQQRFKTESGLAISKLGKGFPLILLHGVGLRSESWDALTKLLRDDFSIHAIDLPGHGESQSLNIEAPQLIDYSDRIAGYIKTLETPVYLGGHSMGAMIASDVAIRFPDLVKSVVALNAIYKRSDKAAHAVKLRAAALKGLSQADLNTDVTLTRWFGDSPTGDLLTTAQSCKTWLHQTPIAEYQQAYEVFAHHDGPSTEELAGLNIPALFLTGADEPNSTPRMSRSMAEAAPMGKAKIIKGAAHMMPMTHAKQISTIIKDYFIG